MKPILAGAMGVGLLAFASPQARADILWTLNGVTFADGAMATGTFALNAYDFQADPLLVVTSATVNFNGYTYTLADPTLINDPSHPIDSATAYTIVTLSRTNYVGYLQLEFENPLTSPGLDLLVLGDVGPYGGSYECDTYEHYTADGIGYCPSNGAQRDITAGGAQRHHYHAVFRDSRAVEPGADGRRADRGPMGTPTQAPLIAGGPIRYY